MSSRRAAIYLRVSSVTQEQEGSSLETQESGCRTYCAAHAYEVAEVFREVHTGVELWERPELTRLRDAVRRRAFDVVVVWAIDRLARDPVHLGVVLSEADHHQVDVEFVTEVLDNGPEGQLVRYVRGYAAKIEHEKIKERTIRGRMARLDKGMPLVGARPPYGYAWRDDRKSGLAVDGLTSGWAKQLFTRLLEGGTLRGVAAGLTAAGVATPSGRSTNWSASTVRAILTSTTYIGEHRVGGHVLRCPILVDAGTFQQVQERLRDNKAHGRRNNSDPTACLLRCGFLRCGSCGYRLGAQYNRVYGTWSYCCPHRGARGDRCPARPVIDARTLDQRVWDRAVEILTQPEIVKNELQRQLGRDPTEGDLAGVDRALAQADRRAANAARVVSQLDADAAAPVLAELSAIAQQRAQLAGERDRILGQRAAWEGALKRLEDVYGWCRQVADQLPTLSYDEKRRALSALDTRVTVWPAAHTPRLEILMGPPFENSTTPGTGHNLLLRMVL